MDGGVVLFVYEKILPGGISEEYANTTLFVCRVAPKLGTDPNIRVIISSIDVTNLNRECACPIYNSPYCNVIFTTLSHVYLFCNSFIIRCFGQRLSRRLVYWFAGLHKVFSGVFTHPILP